MTWLLLLAALIVLTVAGSVLPRRASREQRGFPWFWVAFPITAFAAALAVYSFLPVAPLGFDFGWTMYSPLEASPESSVDPFWSGKIMWVITAVVGAGLSAWAWLRDRV